MMLFTTLSLTSAFVLPIVAASPTPAEMFGRAVGDSCKAPQGAGDCRATRNCKGISYPTGLCPRDPDDIQCCVEITCKADGGSGYCRSKSNNGCSGGKFHPGTKAPYPCPGDNDIQCCIKSSSTPTPPTPPADCKKTLSCTFYEIEAMTLATRLQYVRDMQSNFFGPLNCGNQLRPIEGVIIFFQSENLGSKGSWVSYVDAGIVEGIQNGGAIALGKSTDSNGNPGAEKWAKFMRSMRDGSYGSRDAHDRGWSDAEQASTEYGNTKGLAITAGPTPQQRRWYAFTQLYRAIMRNRMKTRLILFPIVGPFGSLGVEAFLDWLTDTTSDVPTRIGSAVVWELSCFETLEGGNILEDAKCVGSALKKIWEQYQKLK